MIIIAGAGHTKSEKHLLKTDKHCFHCNNVSKWILQKTKHFITLFFLPVVPYKTEYLLYCQICGNTIKFDKDEYERMIKFETKPYQ